MAQPDRDSYFTGADANIVLLTHPDPQWQGKEVDCAFFQLTAGTSPIHIWNYARRSGEPAMSNQSQEQTLDKIQAGVAGGAPFDDTAESNLQVGLQLLINEERFEDTYYKFRSMSEIGDLSIKYDKQVGFEERTDAGYKLIDGRVSTVSRETSTRNSTYPSVQLTFRNIRPLDQTLVIDTGEYAPDGRERGGPGVSEELQAGGLGRRTDTPTFTALLFSGMKDGKKTQPVLGNFPSSLDALDSLQFDASQTVIGKPESWTAEQAFAGAVIVTDHPQQDKRVFFWRKDQTRYREITPRAEAVNQVADLAPKGALQRR